jgi:hypothetical protein
MSLLCSVSVLIIVVVLVLYKNQIFSFYVDRENIGDVAPSWIFSTMVALIWVCYCSCLFAGLRNGLLNISKFVAFL